MIVFIILYIVGAVLTASAAALFEHGENAAAKLQSESTSYAWIAAIWPVVILLVVGALAFGIITGATILLTHKIVKWKYKTKPVD